MDSKTHRLVYLLKSCFGQDQFVVIHESWTAKNSYNKNSYVIYFFIIKAQSSFI